ncbi:threonine aldolase family protein [Demequina lignilytica]|uniref:Beta-eliminating lyase-related protein n=1 Tax=Demequina lignilytica TaxID=3051663 RepID=A0AB35MHZ2_9MICO|nr:beta-eliminating lyase-related protein [Demequina sp. SYSU T0a273]MDN4483396.1 beta-eliminating lyase-related protein [Demequina sp. SYSU T0a273]
MSRPIHFASDNYAAVHPEVMEAIAEANVGHDVAYGADAATAAFDAAIAATFGDDALGFPVFNGTGANIVSLMALSPRWGGVVASEHAHINVDENGAPERVGGLKILALPSVDGRLQPEQLARYAGDLGDEHRAQPVVLSVTQSTELGTVYSLEDLRELMHAAHALGMRVHLDGARIANAAAALGVPLAEAVAGADVLSFGGTKNGAMLGEAVVVLAEDLRAPLAHDLPYLRKQTMQLGSKMRFVSAQLTALLTSTGGSGEPLWHRNASHANAMAARLRAALQPAAASGVLTFTQATESNAVFAVLPRRAAAAVRARFRFYDWQAGPDADSVEVRWMCAWDTREEDVDGFAATVLAACEELA